MSEISQHAEWLSLLDVSGPFLAEPVLKAAFPQGLEKLDPLKRKMLRQAYDEWRETLDLEEAELSEIHKAWTELVLKQGLELDEDGEGETLKSGASLPDSLCHRFPEYDITLKPNYAVVDDQNDDKPLLLVSTYDPEVKLDEPLKGDGWATTPAERMVQLCRATETRLGLVTNGERWMLIDAPVGGVTTYASWYARLWGQEPITLQAFVTLLGIRRFFTDKDEQLPALLNDSLKHQDEVTEALGEQVRRAVEVLIQALDRADVDRNRQLLVGVEPAELYEAALTVMMRLVFLLSAEERELMDVVKDERFEANYAVSSLRMQLRGESEEIQERRWDAWSRLLAIFRAIYGGIEHETLRMPALGGSLFDPDRFPFLEGRTKGTSWQTDEAKPLPIDNRTVLLLLDAIQLFQGRTLSYRALDVEQIGYVYEGLLERTVQRAKEVTLDLVSGKDAKKTIYSLGELESLRIEGPTVLAKSLSPAKAIKRAESAISKDLEKLVDPRDIAKLLTACHNDLALSDRIAPYFHLLRTDRWGYPLVYPEGTFMVTTGTDRRETGTHYTPKSLTEAIVKETLEPVAYNGPAEGKPRENWRLKTPAELLDLKICDPAMGSGAFLVQVCRWLSERLVEAWAIEEQSGKFINAEGKVYETGDIREPLSADAEERLVAARRLIAERCIYGVDINPLAVELAKLSIWLVTLAKGRPFGFLDHNLRCGDSLLGIIDLEQLHYLEMEPGKWSSKKLFAQKIDQVVEEAIRLRSELRSRPIRDIRDVETMARLDDEAKQALELPELIADALIGDVISAGGKNVVSTSLSIEAGKAIKGDKDVVKTLKLRAFEAINTDLPASMPTKRPFHWPLEFPEVFVREQCGFNAIIGNPPFIGNKFWKERLGMRFQMQAKLVLGAAPGKIDLCVVFHRRAAELLEQNGTYGLLATDNIAEGSAISVGLGVIVSRGDIYFSKKGMPWPGAAAVSVSIICFYKGSYHSQKVANGVSCDSIGSRLQPVEGDNWDPRKLHDALFSFEGVNNSKGLAFVVTPESEWYEALRKEQNSLLIPYVTGNDITTHALNRVDRWALDIADRSIDEIERDFPVAHRFLLEVVLPTRTPTALKSYKGLIDRWWQFWNHRADQMRRLRKRDDFIAYCKVTKFPICVLAPSHWIYTNKVILIGIDRGDELAITLSSLFRNWLEEYSGGRLEGRLSLSISESIAKFPLPNSPIPAHGIRVADDFNDLAVQWSRDNGVGMTEVMNAIHSPDNLDPRISELRQKLVVIDSEVSHAYGLSKINFEYAFQEFSSSSTKDRWRYRIDNEAESGLMIALLQLNRDRYEQEVAKGLHAGKKTTRKKSIARKKQKPAKGYDISTDSARELLKVAEPPPPQMDIFEEEDQ